MDSTIPTTKTFTGSIGLSLSGGGYRAAAYHLGTMRTLYNMGILEKVDVLSTISGGSITGARYCLKKDSNYAAFETNMIKMLTEKSVIGHLLLSFTFIKAASFVFLFLGVALYLQFTSYAWMSLLVFAVMLYLLIRYQFKIFPVSREIEKLYNRFLYNNATLPELNTSPILVIGSTNLQTSRPFSFSKGRMWDTRYRRNGQTVEFKHQGFPVARAVMASSCVPFAFSPINIESDHMIDTEYFDEIDNETKRIDAKLVDGGVFDNQGVHRIAYRESGFHCDVIIASDAGNKMPFEEAYNNQLSLLSRTTNVFMERIRNFQRQQFLYENTRQENRQITYVSLAWDFERCITGFIDNLAEGQITREVIDHHRIPKEWEENVETNKVKLIQLIEANVQYSELIKSKPTAGETKLARSVTTNLTALRKDKVSALIKHAANLTELQIRLYCPSLVHSTTPASNATIH